jgi:hypothetical protein
MIKIQIKSASGMGFRLAGEHSQLARQIHFWQNSVLTDCDDKGGQFNEELYLKYLKAKFNHERNSESQTANSSFVGSTYQRGKRTFTSRFLHFCNNGH